MGATFMNSENNKHIWSSQTITQSFRQNKLNEKGEYQT